MSPKPRSGRLGPLLLACVEEADNIGKVRDLAGLYPAVALSAFPAYASPPAVTGPRR